MKGQIISYLHQYFPSRSWQLTPTGSTGHETYFADGGDRPLFIKLGANLTIYETMSAAGLTPHILDTGTLPSGQSILIQPKIDGRTPSRPDFQAHPEKFATLLNRTHQNNGLKQALRQVQSTSHKDLAAEAMKQLSQKWGVYRPQVLNLADTVDEKLAQLNQEVQEITTEGVIASHNDICNANWLITKEKDVFLIDPDSMTLDDPAVDLGALLWWYYPPSMRGRFLEQMGYQHDDQLKKRMRIRMAIHCLNILLPRENSFDQFSPKGFSSWVGDFFAVVDGKENPQGYD